MSAKNRPANKINAEYQEYLVCEKIFRANAQTPFQMLSRQAMGSGTGNEGPALQGG
jgi:hypothetical protein